MSSSTVSSGELDLSNLLASIKPSLHPETFVFVTLAASQQAPPQSLHQQMLFREKEGLTVITTQASAREHGLESAFPSRMITLDVHSSLDAVGFLAVVTSKLTQLGMGANPVSGYFHDHLFVPLGREAEAMEALGALADDAKKGLEG